tara:strand:+ start:124 stop:1182 length:1059 start_codon:yes stop_codon:yes gene_type:complete
VLKQNIYYTKKYISHPIAFMFLSIILLLPTEVLSNDQQLNLYTARHYSSDKEIYKIFTKETGIKIKEITSKDQALLERLKSEGSASPADVIILADAARLWRAEKLGFFQNLDSNKISKTVPKQFQSNNKWTGLTTRARIIVVNKRRYPSKKIESYNDLANKEFKNQFCSRSSTHPYMLSLVSSMIINNGIENTKNWASKVVSNQARIPRGGDTDQIRAVASGECGVALTNSYYLVRLMRSSNPRDRAVVKKVRFVLPNQKTSGTHINVTGGGIAKHSPNPENAKLFLEFLISKKVQQLFAKGNNEWPIIENIKLNNKKLTSIGKFKRDKLTMEEIGENQFGAQRLLDNAGWK